MLTEGHGVPIGVTIEGAHRHDIACDAGEHFRGSRRRSDGKEYVWTRGMTMKRCVRSCAHDGTHSQSRRGSEGDCTSSVQWWSAVTVGLIGFAAC
jgi:hypothetical protein